LRDPGFAANKEQIERVKQRSDAFELRLAGKDVMVAHLIEVTRSGGLTTPGA
jgi:hypothetical protein